jgi:hypothetical protein
MASAAKQLESIEMGGVPSDGVMNVWPGVEPLLRRVVTPDTGQTLQSVLTSLLMAKMQLWVIGNFQGVVITEIQDRPAERVLFTLYLAGEDMKAWLDDWCDLQDEYARHNGCAAVEFNGRKGWNKIGESRPEWKSIRTVFRREFSE